MAPHPHSAIKTDYPFLAHPPLQQERSFHHLPVASSRPSRETAPTCGPHRRIGTFSSVAAWAAQVQPGSPASVSPRSPRLRPSFRRARRPSIASIRVPSASFFHIAPTPTTTHPITPSTRDFKTDLTTVGYTSVFLHLPNTPVSATPPLAIKPISPGVAKNVPILPIASPPCKPRAFARFRSLSVLRSRGRSKSVGPDSTTKMKAKAAVAIAKHKKAKYAIRPPPLVNELALMQFADGGSMNDNIKRVMEAQAKAAGTAGLADVYRDGKDGIWWDQDEEWEYAHLLSEGDESRPHVAGDLQWVTFGDNAAGMPGEERRGSVSTQGSHLDPKCIVQPNDLLDGHDPALPANALVSLATHKPATSALSLPSQPRRAATHLRKFDFLVDVAFSGDHAFPTSPKFPTSTDTNVGVSQSKRKVRRRPAPLKLATPTPGFKRPTNSPIDADRVRKDFIADSFEPAVSVPVTPATPATAIRLNMGLRARARLAESGRVINVPRRTVNESSTSRSRGMKKPSMLNMIGLFRSARKEDVC